MKKALLFGLILTSLAFAKDILPQNFGSCSSLGYFTQNNAPIPLKDSYIDIKKYSCNNNIVYIGIQNTIAGILKLNVNNDTKDFLLKHFKINGYNAAVYIDKHLQKGVIAVKLDNSHTLKLLFKGNDYKPFVKILKELNLKEIKKSL